ncbi:magnesium transporter MgtE N-terminal domain-containing protein [Celeribacter sp.]|uniref:MotE family protein n=1 Tax=Celeribacter sp. TaxID=1890673 RepID=UPI003A936F18
MMTQDKKSAKPPVEKRAVRRPWKMGRGSMTLVALILVGSVAVRLASGTGAAIAKEFAGLSDLDHAEVEPVDPIACMAGDELDGLVAALRAREKEVEARELEIDQKMAVVERARAEVEQSFAALEEAEAKLASTMTVASTAAENDVARLTAVYENMKAKDAAELFEAMSPDFAAGFLGRMRPDAAAEIMAGLKPETAYSISVILAGRNANAPVE